MMSDIDRRIAIEVMGWQDYADGWHIPTPDGDWPWSGHYSHEWAPSVRIDHAWEVLEFLKKNHILVMVALGGVGWWCTLYPKAGPSIDSEYYETAPLAICNTALEAMK